jgi:pyrroloquinoline quinone biosynthesis protein D
MLAPTSRSDLATRVVDGEVVILDRANGTVHRLNATAAAIWKLCDGEHSVAAIAEHIDAAYDQAPDDVRGEVSRTIVDFERLGLLEPSAADER